jgi:hypothetical protein
MPTAADVARRIDQTSRRLDLIADVGLEKARRDVREMRRADALDAEEQRAYARKQRELCVKHQVAYEERFARHGLKAPQAVADDTGADFRRKLFGVAQTLLPDGHSLTKFDPRDLDHSAIAPMERTLFEALDEQAVRPTGSNLPLSPDDPRAMRAVVDAMGVKKTEFHARRSFIADMGRTGRKVLRLIDPVRGYVLIGPPLPSARG